MGVKANVIKPSILRGEQNFLSLVSEKDRTN